MSTKSTDHHKRHWFKSSFSKEAASCVEVCFAGSTVLVRDSKYTGPAADQPIIAIPVVDWAGFLTLAAGDVETSTALGMPAIEHDDATGNAIVRDSVGTELVYAPREWRAFTAGIRASEFAPAKSAS